MQFADWEPLYLAILVDFGFSRFRDEEAAKLLQDLLCGREQSMPAAKERICGHDVVVCGNAPTLGPEVDGLDDVNFRENITIIAADGATAVLLSRGIVPGIVVTDLDGPFDAVLQANLRGAVAVVHAHGDNLDALRRCVPQLKNVIGTVQCRPLEGLNNFGGFTDGDRCVFLAKELGAASIKLVGFDFEDEGITPRKRKKLAWAKKLIDIV
jgi:2-amino-4-hydroxy-6-hydroxymethyldihydropteridine diphosphokinase